MAITKVTNSLVATNAIQGTLIADNAITSVHIAQNQVTSVQIPDSSITSTQLAANSVDTAELISGSIDAIHLASDSVTTAKILDANVTTAKIANNAITSALIPDGSITDTQLGSGAFTMGNITTTGSIRGPASFTIDPAAVGDNTGTVVIAGSLQVDGTTTTINSSTLSVADKKIELASGAANASAANDSGITVTGANATLRYLSSGDKWSTNKDLEVNSKVNTNTINNIGNTANIIYRSSTNTIVGNNATALVVQDGGNIGIGKANPGATLDIEKSSGATLFMNDTNGRTLRFRTANSGSQNSNISSYSGLYLGGSDNASHVLIAGDGDVTVNSGIFTSIHDITTVNKFKTTNSNTRSIISMESKDSSGNAVDLRMHALGDGPRGEVYTYTNHPLAFATNNAAPQMTLLTNGNFGIDEDTPATRLHVVGGRASGTMYNTAVFAGGQNSTSGSGARLYISGCENDPIARGTIIEGKMNDNGNSHELNFYTSGNSQAPAKRLTIDNNGRVRIGATLGLNHLLNIQTASTSGLAQIEFRNTQAGTQIGMPANTNALSFFTADAERMRIGSGGAIDIANNQLGWYDNANSSWQTGVLRFDDLNFKNAGGSSLLLIDGGANTVTASGTLSSVNGLHSNHHQVYGTGTSGFLISLNVATNNYAFIMGEIKLEQFNFSTIQTIEFSATVLNTGAVQSVKASCDVPVTIKLFNYSNSWYVWVPSPSTFTTCSAYIHMGDGYQGGTRGSNCINTLSHAAVPSSGVTNSTDIVCEQRIKANSSGNVGIGTSSPGAKLEVSGKDDAGASDLLRLIFDNSPADTGITMADINSTIKNRITMDASNTNDLRISAGTQIHLYGGTTNGTSSPHLTVDSSGRILTPNQPGFFARGNTSQWLQGSSGSWNTIVSGIAHANGSTIGVNLTEGSTGHLNGYDTGSDFNTSNGRFTAPVEGKYLIHGSMYCTKVGTNANDYMHFLVYVNGQQINQMYTMGGHKQAYAHDFSLNLSTVLFLEASDYVEWKIYTTSTNMRIYGDHLCIGAHMVS